MSGTVVNEPILVRGKVGHGLRLEGDAQYIKIGENARTRSALLGQIYGERREPITDRRAD